MTKTSPKPGQIAHVRQRRYLVEDVVAPLADGEATLVHLSCISALGARIRRACAKGRGWSSVAKKRFDSTLFAAYPRTLSWNCVKATDPNLLTMDATLSA